MLNGFDINSLPDLDTAVLGSLELFSQSQLPEIDLKQYQRPLVVGSGNAEATGRIIYGDSDAVFASESNFEEKLKAIPAIDGVVLISASGGKHAPIIAKAAKQAGKPVTLLTNNPDSPAVAELERSSDAIHVFPKNREPYTYNTSTYMGMILAATKENPAEILSFINQKVSSLEMPDFGSYMGFYLIVPPEFSGIIRMLQVKFIELFGRKIARDVETSEYVRHATTVVPSDELFICFGQPNDKWGEPGNRLNVPLPDNAGYAAMMAIGYYIVAQIQKAQPPYFKQNIAAWAKTVSEMFGENLESIVPGN